MISNRKIKVVIIVDNGSRDLLSCRLLQIEFEKQGFEVLLTDKRLMKIDLRKYKPDAVVIPRGDLPYLKDFAKAGRLYLVPCEGGRLTLKTMLSVFLGRVHKGGDVLSKDEKRLDHSANEIMDFNHIRRVYFWGPLTYNFLSDTNYFKKEQLKISGCVKLDIYRKAMKINNPKGKNFTLGVAFSAKATSCFYGKIPYAEVLYGIEDRSHVSVVPRGKNWEDYAWRDFAMLRWMMRLVKKFLETEEGKVIIRVNPFEDPNDYEFLKKKYPNRVEIQHDKGEIYEFLEDIDVLLTCWSTLGIEAVLSGVPVIAIPYLLDYDYLIQHVDAEANGFSTFLPCYYLPKSEEEVFDYIEKARRRELGTTPEQMESKRKLLKDVYNWPMKDSAAKTIVDDIKRDFTEGRYQVGEEWKNVVRFPGVVEGLIKVLLVFGEKTAYEIISVLYQAKFFLEDVYHKRLKGSSRHHMTKNVHVESVLKKVEHSNINSELLKELENEARHPEAVH